MSAQDVQALLRERGAATIAHPGGTLHAHLVRVHDRLAAHGLPEATALAGLAHAAYGTDGFATALLTLDERDLLRAAAGEHAELIVYRYGATLRKATWRQLASTRQVHDRFTGTAETLTPDQLRPLADVSIVNELDLCEQAPDVAARYGDYFRDLFASWAQLASPPVLADARAVLRF
ncbi:DUF6817 domain-containing protein [Catellatospora bangladeshensis]|uniref:DUF6817 domain-containing protein n=1 Tax=Catellatospora bangladeshensis TaxID=310355 RepID=A0A8J3JGL7_9ACTN|nr:hypothetical protein [Catellatospora bangladeshensis]GIF80296.1 hypothetical protein Cba03nite_16450 [Catellatospora bangladeshensis]